VRPVKKGVLTHILLHAEMDGGYGNTQKVVRSDLKSASFNKELIPVNMRKMRKLVGRLDWQVVGSEWGPYQEFHNYSEESDHERVESFIEDGVEGSGANLVWDTGCKNDQFSKRADNHADQDRHES
jgi:hypothetical protein